MITGHVNSPRVKTFVATKLLHSECRQRLPRRDIRHSRGVCVAQEWDTQQKTQTQRTTKSRSFTRHLARWSASCSNRIRIFADLPNRVSSSFAPARKLPLCDLGCGNPFEPIGAGCRWLTPLHTSSTPAPPSSVPTPLDIVRSAPHAGASRLSGQDTLVSPQNPMRAHRWY